MALVVASAFISLLALQGISHSTADSLVSYSLSKLPAGERNLTLTSSQTLSSPSQYQAIDQYLTKNLKNLISGSLSREIIYSELSDPHGVRFYFGATNNLTQAIHLTSGRLPTKCDPTQCEVVQIGGIGAALPRPSSLGLTIVGTATFLDNKLFAGTMGPPVGTPLLVSNGIAASSVLPYFTNLHGADGWVGNIQFNSLNKSGVTGYINAIVAFEDQLSIDYPDIILTWPQDALSGASDQANTASQKFQLLDFAIWALLLSFLALIALRQRKEHQLFRAALSRIGTPKGILFWELLIESTAPLFFGTVSAGVISFAIPKLLSAFNYHASLSQIYPGWSQYLLIILISVGLMMGISTSGDSAWRRQKWISFVLSSLLLLALLFDAGTSNARYWTIPIIYTSIPALICYFTLQFLGSHLFKKSRHTFLIFREHLSIWQGVTAILALTSILAMMALSFDSGISQTVIRESQNQVPLDISLKTGSSLIRPLDIGGTEDYAHLLSGSNVYPVLRTGTSVRGQSTVSDSLSLIGVPPGAMTLIDPSLGALASTLKNSEPADIGLAMNSSKVLTVTLENIPPEIDLLGWFLTPRGTHLSAMFTGAASIRTLSLVGQIPQNSSLIAFEFRESSNYLSRRLHAIGEGNYSVPELKGTGSIQTISLDGRLQSLPGTSWGSKGFSYAFDGQSLYIRPHQGQVIPQIIVDPTTASLANKGLLTLTGASNNYFQVKIGAVKNYFPSAGNRFAIMDLKQMQNEIAQTDLGATDPIELWISTANSPQYLKNLSTSGLQGLEVQSKRELQTELRADPNNVGLNSAYRISLIFALLIAVLMYLTALPLLYREGTKILFYLEANGAVPSKLRSALRNSLRISVTAGVLIGTAIGLTVGRIFISQSIPFLNIVVLLASSIAISEVGGFLFTRGFFREEKMVKT